MDRRKKKKTCLLGVIGENIRYPTAFLVHFKSKHKAEKEKVSCTGQARVMCDAKNFQDDARVTSTRTPSALHPGKPYERSPFLSNARRTAFVGVFLFIY